MPRSLYLVSEFDDFLELLIFVLELFIGLFKILDFLLARNEFFLNIFKIAKQLFIFSVNLGPVGGMACRLGLLATVFKYAI